MAINFSSSTLSRRIPGWVSLKANISSISCAINDIQPTPESEQPQSNSPDFDEKILSLKKKLHSDTLVSVLDNTPDLNSSIKLFKWASLQKQFRHTSETYRLMILKLGMAGNLEEMEGFCNELVREKCRGYDKSLLTLIDSFVGSDRFSEALRVLYVMNSSGCSHLSIETFNSLMAALAESKRDFKDLLFVYKEMVKAGIVPNENTLNHLMEGLLESGRVDIAMDQYRRMGKKGCKPNIRTFEILISGLACRDRVEESITILEEMFQSGCEADVRFYVRIIPIFCGMKNLDIGLRLFDRMRASNLVPDCVTYSAMIRCLCQCVRLDDGIKLFGEMKDNGLLPGSQVCIDIINGFCELKKLAEAKDFLEENNISDPCLHNMILESYCESGLFPKDKFDKMLESGMVDATSWNILIRFLCKKSMLDNALEWLCRMVVSSFHPDSDTYSSLILGNCKAGNLVIGLDLFCFVRSKGWVLDSVSYAEFVECLCERGNIRQAADVFRYMARKGSALQLGSFGLLIEKVCADGDVYESVKLLSLAYYCGVYPIGTTYNSILRSLSKLGRENHLLMILSRMIVFGCAFDVETYSIIIQHMSAMNRLGNCVSLFDLMLREGWTPDPETLDCLLSFLAKHSRMHLILHSMDKIALKSEFLDPMLYNILIRSLWREGYETEARRLLDVILEKGKVPDASTHALLMGCVEGEDIPGRKSNKENYDNQDNVSCILEDGLGRIR